MECSILLSFGAGRPEQTASFANIVRWTSAERLWFGQGTVLESHHLISWLAGMGIRIPTGLGVSLMPLRSPFNAALESRSAALMTGQSVVAGFGPGGPGLQRGVMASPYASPLGASRAYVTIVRDLLDGKVVNCEGPDFSVHAQLLPARAPRIEVGLGVLRPKMAALAGEVADVAITWLAAADHLEATILPATRTSTRLSPDPLRVVAYVPVAVSGPGRDLQTLVGATCGAHLDAPHYRAALAAAGITTYGDADPRDRVALVDHKVFEFGTAVEIAEGLAAYRHAGVDEVVLNATGVGVVHGPQAAARDLLAILEAVDAVAAGATGGPPAVPRGTEVPAGRSS